MRNGWRDQARQGRHGGYLEAGRHASIDAAASQWLHVTRSIVPTSAASVAGHSQEEAASQHPLPARSRTIRRLPVMRRVRRSLVGAWEQELSFGPQMELAPSHLSA